MFSSVKGTAKMSATNAKFLNFVRFSIGLISMLKNWPIATINNQEKNKIIKVSIHVSPVLRVFL